jgi:hypothetical protein
MVGNLDDKRRDLDRVYDHIERLEHDGGNAQLVEQYRALSRQLVDEIDAMERRGDA